MTATVRVVLPAHLRTLASVTSTAGDVTLAVTQPVTPRAIIDALEERYPMLRGTVRDHTTRARRPLVRFFACEEDVSHDSLDTPLCASVAEGKEPFLIVGAIAGG